MKLVLRQTGTSLRPTSSSSSAAVISCALVRLSTAIAKNTFNSVSYGVKDFSYFVSLSWPYIYWYSLYLLHMCNEYEILKNLQKLPLTESQYLHPTQKFYLFHLELIGKTKRNEMKWLKSMKKLNLKTSLEPQVS